MEKDEGFNWLCLPVVVSTCGCVCLWLCLHCSTLVFAKRDTCFKCKAPKPSESATLETKPVGGVGGEAGGEAGGVGWEVGGEGGEAEGVGGEAGGGDNCGGGSVAGEGSKEDGGRLGEAAEGGRVDGGQGGGRGEWGGVRQRTKNALHAQAWKWPIADAVRLQSQQYVRTIYHIDVEDEPLRVPLPDTGGTAVMYRVKLVGASFALNQIRKMMGLVLSVLHGTVPESVLTIALSSPFRVHVPLAPGESLILTSQSFWDAKREEVRVDLSPRPVQDSISAFKRESLYPHIASLLHTPRVCPQKQKSLQRRASKNGGSMLLPSNGEGEGGGGGDGGEPELVFDSFFRQLGSYCFPPTGKDEALGWELLESEYGKWEAMRSEVRDQAVAEREEAHAPKVPLKAGGGRGGGVMGKCLRV